MVWHMCGIAVKQKVRHLWGMSRDDLHFRLRIPEDLKKKVEISARENHRSMTAEIVARLEATFTVNVKMLQAEIAKPAKDVSPNDDQSAFIITAEQAQEIQKAITEIKEELRKMRENPIIADDGLN